MIDPLTALAREMVGKYWMQMARGEFYIVETHDRALGMSFETKVPGNECQAAIAAAEDTARAAVHAALTALKTKKKTMYITLMGEPIHVDMVPVAEIDALLNSTQEPTSAKA